MKMPYSNPKAISNEDKCRQGDLAEYYAVTWLWDNGYEVFKNSACTGPIDLIAMKSGDIIFIDVKTLTWDEDRQEYRIKASLSNKQTKLGVQILGFNPESRKFRWVNHNHETGYSRYRDEQSAQQNLVLCDAGS